MLVQKVNDFVRWCKYGKCCRRLGERRGHKGAETRTVPSGSPCLCIGLVLNRNSLSLVVKFQIVSHAVTGWDAFP